MFTYPELDPDFARIIVATWSRGHGADGSPAQSTVNRYILAFAADSPELKTATDILTREMHDAVRRAADRFKRQGK